MTKPHLALDFDSVLAATQHVAFDLMLGPDHDYSYDDIEDWEWGFRQFGKNRYLSALWHAWTLRPSEIEPMEENLSQKVAALHSKYNVHIVTAHPDHPGISEGKQQWLAEHGIGHEDFVVVNMTSKSELGYDVFIDDNPNLPPECDDDQTVYLRDQPYNQDADGDYIRIESITEPLRAETQARLATL
jgi:5'(3')-deoxyribonucleotidase